MSERQEIVGQWWLPAAPDERWIGTLILESNESPRLSVTVPKGFFQLPKREALPAIHGHDKHGKPITLLFPGVPGTQGGAAMSQMDFTAGYALLGVHLDNAADFEVHSLSFGMQHLYEWLGTSGFVMAEPDTAIESHIHYKRPDDQVFSVSADLRLELRVVTSARKGQSEKSLREDACVGFEDSSGLNLARCNELITAMRHLLHFAVLKRVYPMWISTERKGYGYSIDGRFIPHEIKPFSSILRERVESEFEAGRWVFRFADVQAQFAQFFGDWLKVCQRFEEALGCYSATVYHRLPASLENLCLAQALEAYHGVKFGKQTFRARIRALAQQFRSRLTGLVPDAAKFSEQVRDNRNFYTHHDAAMKRSGHVLTGSNLLRLNEKLKLLFQMCVLTEMGIPSDRFGRLRRQLASWIIDYV